MPKKTNVNTIAKVQATEYDLWVVQEFNGNFSLIDGWEGNDGKVRPNFCTIETKNGDKNIPKGLGGRFDSLEDLMAVLGKLYGKCKRALEAGEGADDVPPF
jgi:hypothetical protein